MIKNYLKIAFRNLGKNVGFTTLNIVSLSLCLMTIIGILLIASKLLNFDSFHELGERIYIVEEGDKDRDAEMGTVYPALDKILEDYPEVESGSRMVMGYKYNVIDYKGNFTLNTNFVDPAFLSMFTYPLKYGRNFNDGQPENSIILSSDLSKKIFGKDNPIGKELNLNDEYRVTVCGVLEDIPGASAFRFEALMPIEWLYRNNEDFKNKANWKNSFVPTFVLLKSGVDATAFENKLANITQYYLNQEAKPFVKLLLYENLIKKYVPIFNYIMGGLLAVVAFLCLIASMNLVSVTFVTALKRNKEVGIRKILGSSNMSISKQFFLESSIVIFISLLVALLCVPLIISYFNKNIITEFQVDFILAQDYPMVFWISVIFLVLAFAATWYPASYLNRTPVSASIKGTTVGKFSTGFLKKALIVFQFAIAVIFIFMTVGIKQQIDFMKNSDLGFNANDVMVVELYQGKVPELNEQQEINVLVNKLKQFTQVRDVTVGSSIPGEYQISYYAYRAMDEEGKEVRLRNINNVDDGFFPTFDIKFLAGRNFSYQHRDDAHNSIIINQAAVKKFGWKESEAVNKTIKGINAGDTVIYTVVGVTEDFNYRSLNSSIEPIAHYSSGPVDAKKGGKYLSINMSTKDVRPVIASVKQHVKANGDLNYFFINEKFNQQYERENMMMSLIGSSSLITIIIGGIGIFALVAQMTRFRLKEVAIRKTLGASTLNIMYILSYKTLILVILAVVIAAPLGWLIMDMWLASFPFRVSISIYTFIITGIISLLIAAATIGFIVMKSAKVSPIKVLRSD